MVKVLLMNIVMLCDYQDSITKLTCASKLEAFSGKVYTNRLKGLSQLSIRLKDADIIVLNHDLTHISKQLLQKTA